jgi:hypothetical protein
MPDTESTNPSTLVFVYNADGGALNTLLDIGHKLVSPQTYSCNLCALTHSTFSMRGEWRRFVDELGLPVEFLHRDELAERYGLREARLPAIFLASRSGLKLYIAQEEINRCRSLDDLKRLVVRKLKA